MKKTLGILVTLFFCMGILVANVSGKAPSVPEGWPKDIVFGGGPSPATSHYLLVAYFGNLLRKEYGIRSTPVPDNSEKNCLSVSKGDRVVGQSVGPISQWALRGEKMFARVGPQKALRGLAVTSDIQFAFVTLKKSGIKTVADFRGKKLAGDYKGASYMLMLIKELLPAYGLTEKDLIIGAYGRSPEAYNNVASGLADIGACIAPKGMPFAREFFMKHDGMYVPLSEGAMKRVTDRWDWVSPTVLPAGLYRGLTEEVPTLAMRLNFVTNRDLPDDFVYQLTKYMFHEKYRADFEKVHRTFRSAITLERAVSGYTIPYHAGAVKFYKESGVWNPTIDKWQKDQLRNIGEKR